MSAAAMAEGIPLNLITGFLGAGKTTLLNRVLDRGFDGSRVAVIVNDFGSLAVDAALLDQAADDMLSLPNGCVCCTLAGDLLTGLDRLLKAGYQRILMEASGVTRVEDLRSLVDGPGLAARCRLESVVAVVDAARYLTLRKVLLTVDEQVRTADTLLLNRADLVEPAVLEACREALREINADARMVDCSFCDVELSSLFRPTGEAGLPADGPQSAGDAWHAFVIRADRPLDRGALEQCLQRLPAALYRLKGFVTDADGHPIHVEVAGGQVRLESVQHAIPADAGNALAAIGSPDLARSDLAACFAGLDGVRVEASTANHAHHGQHPGHAYDRS